MRLTKRARPKSRRARFDVVLAQELLSAIESPNRDLLLARGVAGRCGAEWFRGERELVAAHLGCVRTVTGGGWRRISLNADQDFGAFDPVRADIADHALE